MMRAPRLLCRHHLGIERGRRPRTIRRPDRHAPRCRRRCRGCGSDDGRCCARRSRAACRAALRTPARRTPHAARRRRCASLPPVDRDLRQFLDAVDVDQMRRLRQPERHDRHQALPARQHPAVVGRDLRQHRDRLSERLRRVIAEGGGFHGSFIDPRAVRARARAPFHIWDFYYFLDSGTVFLLCKGSTPASSRSDEATALQLPRPAHRRRRRRPARQARQRQAPGRRAVDDADAQHAVRAARPHHRPQQGRGPLLHPRGERRARDRRHDAPARHRILRRGAPALPADARGDPACRPPPDPQPRHHRRLALPSRSVGRAGDRRRRDGRHGDGAGAERHARRSSSPPSRSPS